MPEGQARAIVPGLTVKVSPTGATEPLTGKVDTVLPDVNPATRTIKVRIVLPNQGRHLLPGMFVTVRFDSGEQKEALLIPVESVIRTGQRSVVMVDAGKAGFVATEVKTGREAAGMIEVLDGLKAGQKVVTSGQFLIDSEASLRGTTERMTAMPAASAPLRLRPSTRRRAHRGREWSAEPDHFTRAHSVGPVGGDDHGFCRTARRLAQRSQGRRPRPVPLPSEQ